MSGRSAIESRRTQKYTGLGRSPDSSIQSELDKLVNPFGIILLDLIRFLVAGNPLASAP